MFTSDRSFASLVAPLLLLAWGLQPASVQAQPTGIRALSMGGGLSAVNGHNALYAHPARLLQDGHRRALTLGAFQGRLGGDLLRYGPYEEVFVTDAVPSEAVISQALTDWFGGETRGVGTVVQATPVAFTWQRADSSRGLGIALRFRSFASSRTDEGIVDLLLRGTQTDRTVPLNGGYQTFSVAELVFGVSQRITDRLTVGVAPALLLGTGYADADLTSTLDVQDGVLTHQFDYEARAAGAFSSDVYDTFDAFSSDPFEQVDTPSPLGEQSGLGLGLTVSATYRWRPTLTVDASLMDLGGLRWSGNAQVVTPVANQFRFEGIELNIQELNDEFDGNVDDYVEDKLDAQARNAYEDVNRASDGFATSLPTTAHVGATWVPLDWTTVVGGLSMGLAGRKELAPRTPALHVGTEMRPLRVLPLRGGVRLGGNRAAMLSLGTGVDTRRYSIGIGVAFSPSSDLLGGGGRYSVALSLATVRF